MLRPKYAQMLRKEVQDLKTTCLEYTDGIQDLTDACQTVEKLLSEEKDKRKLIHRRLNLLAEKYRALKKENQQLLGECVSLKDRLEEYPADKTLIKGLRGACSQLKSQNERLLAEKDAYELAAHELAVALLPLLNGTALRKVYLERLRSKGVKV